MHGNRSVVIAAILIVSTAAASTIEDNGVHYQFDGGTFHDAPDNCDDANATWQVKIDNSTSGMLVPEDDEVDYYVLQINATDLGTRLTVDLEAAEIDFQSDLGLDVSVPDCGSSVKDAQNQPAPPPDHPEPGAGERQVQVHNLESGGWSCDNSKWHFVINQIRSPVTSPASIYVVWTNGDNETVNLTHETNQAAHYDTTSNLDVTVHSASFVIDSSWNGRFVLGAGPCDAGDGGAVFGQNATWTNTTIEFTPTQTGEHKVRVEYVGMREASVGTSASNLLGPRTMNCHGCAGIDDDSIEQILYDLTVT